MKEQKEADMNLVLSDTKSSHTIVNFIIVSDEMTEKLEK